jgi:hypothetical protein
VTIRATLVPSYYVSKLSDSLSVESTGDKSGRYSTVIETLSQYVPVIAVEVRTLVLNSDPPVATTFPVIISQPDDLVLRPADAPEDKEKGLASHDEASGTAERAEFAKFARDMHRWCNEKIGPTTTTFRPKVTSRSRRGSERSCFRVGPAEPSINRVISMRR